MASAAGPRVVRGAGAAIAAVVAAPKLRTSAAADEGLSSEDVRAYHAALQRLRGIGSMREAVQSPGANVYWDFGAGRALPGRLWQEHVPEEWRGELQRDYTREEMMDARKLTGIDEAKPVPADQRPRCVFLLGPPGAGKSSCLPKAASVLNLDLENFVSIDGDDLRTCHGAWRRRVEEDPVNGYADCFKVFKAAQKKWRGKFDTLKIELTTEAQRDRKNVLVCDTKINQHVLENFRAQNYEVVVIGLLISQEESQMRNRNRGQQIGRFGDSSPKAWHVCMDALRLLTQPEQSDRVVVFDSSDLRNPTVVFSRTHDRGTMERAIDEYARQIRA